MIKPGRFLTSSNIRQIYSAMTPMLKSISPLKSEMKIIIRVHPGMLTIPFSLA